MGIIIGYVLRRIVVGAKMFRIVTGRHYVRFNSHYCLVCFDPIILGVCKGHIWQSFRCHLQRTYLMKLGYIDVIEITYSFNNLL